MRAVRRAALAILLCAAPVVVASAHASTGPMDRVALREVLRHHARASARGAIQLPLPESPRAPAAATGRELGVIASGAGSTRVLVGVRDHGDLAGVAQELRL